MHAAPTLNWMFYSSCKALYFIISRRVRGENLTQRRIVRGAKPLYFEMV